MTKIHVSSKFFKILYKKCCIIKKISIFASVLIIKTCSHEHWLQVKGFINFGFWFLKILAFGWDFLVFGKSVDTDSVTVISHEFHNRRSLYMAQHNGLDAIAFNAATTTILRWRIIMFLRERASRVKAVLFCRRQAS